MKEFMILIREDLENLNQMTPEEIEADIRKVSGWVAELAAKGQYVGGQPLESDGKVVRQSTITDGPYLELKEGVSGYLIIQAADLGQAAELASTFPTLSRGDTLEVRPLMKIPNE